jgi:signal transduction histidine kinase
MKKRTTWMILALMSIALLGVIAVQVYWLSRAAHLEERLFKERVNQAMERVVRRLEAREMKAQVMKNLSEVRRTVNDAKTQQFQLQREREERKARQTSLAPAQFADNASTKQGGKARLKTLADSSVATKMSPDASAPQARILPNNGSNMSFQAESGSFEMQFGNGSFSFRSSQSRQGSAPNMNAPNPPQPPSFVVTVPSNNDGQALRIVFPDNVRSLLRKDSLARRMKSRFENYAHRNYSGNYNSYLNRNGQRELFTGNNELGTPNQSYIGGKKTLEDRINAGDKRSVKVYRFPSDAVEDRINAGDKRRCEECTEEYQAAQIQRNLARSQRQLEQLRKLNVMGVQDMRQLDSVFHTALGQALQEFGAFGLEVRIPNGFITQTSPEQAATALRDSASVASARTTSAKVVAKNASRAASKQRSASKNVVSSQNQQARVSSPNTSNYAPLAANMIARDTIDKILDRVDFVENVMETMFTGKRVVTERVSMNDIDSLLRNELQHSDIAEAFEYGIMRGGSVMRGNVGANTGGNASNTTGNHDSMMIVKSAYNHTTGLSVLPPNKPTFSRDLAQKRLLTSKFRAQLFPNDLFANEEHFLVVHFPNYTPGLSLAAIGSEVSLSAAFLLMIVGCFGFTLVALVKQKKLSDMKTDFINNMTHELKTPIATISIASEALKDDHIRSEGARVERFVNIIHDENKRLAGHVEKVLQAAQMDKGDLKLNLGETDVHTVVESAAESLALQLEQKQGSIELHLNATKASIQADEAHLTNIIFNLLDNANKYTPDAPRIIITTRNTAQGLALTIQDNGIGMTREAQKHIFEKFYRVPTGNRHDVKGFGLGLNYVQTIVEAHGGSISVKSEVGKGSTFEVLLPFAVKHRALAGV